MYSVRGSSVSESYVLLLGSDWPHAEGTRAPVDFVSESLVGIPDDTVRRIGRDNALDLLGITLG